MRSGTGGAMGAESGGEVGAPATSGPGRWAHRSSGRAARSSSAWRWSPAASASTKAAPASAITWPRMARRPPRLSPSSTPSLRASGRREKASCPSQVTTSDNGLDRSRRSAAAGSIASPGWAKSTVWASESFASESAPSPRRTTAASSAQAASPSPGQSASTMEGGDRSIEVASPPAAPVRTRPGRGSTSAGGPTSTSPRSRRTGAPPVIAWTCTVRASPSSSAAGSLSRKA